MNTIIIPTDTIKGMALFVSKGNKLSPHICGIRVEVTETQTRLISTDGGAMCVCKLDTGGNPCSFLIPAGLVEDSIRLAKKANGISINFSGGKVSASVVGAVTASYEATDKYADWRRVIPAHVPKMPEVEPPPLDADLLAKVKKASKLATGIGQCYAYYTSDRTILVSPSGDFFAIVMGLREQGVVPDFTRPDWI